MNDKVYNKQIEKMSMDRLVDPQQIIETIIKPYYQNLSQSTLKLIQLLISEARNQMSVKQFAAHREQWKTFCKKLNTESKLSYLRQENCRLLIIELIREEAMHLFNLSYLNRAKIDQQLIRYLKQLGPYFFIEVILVVSKLKTIHKHFYCQMSQKISENCVDIKIVRILQLCNEKKRSINNNKAKFLCIVEDQTDRLDITKKMGKMLREAWKREKSKQFSEVQEQIVVQEQSCYDSISPVKEQIGVEEQSCYDCNSIQPVKESVKPLWGCGYEQVDDYILDENQLMKYVRQYSDDEEIFNR